MRCRKIVNGLPFLQLFSSHLTLAAITRAHTFIQQARGYRARRWPAHHRWYSGSCPTCYTVYGSAQPFKNTVTHANGSHLEQFVSVSFRGTEWRNQRPSIGCHSSSRTTAAIHEWTSYANTGIHLDLTSSELKIQIHNHNLFTSLSTPTSGGAYPTFSPQHFV